MKIRIQNFQRHADTLLDVQPGLTSLIGRSDHGKTSVWRSIFWFKFDRPLGTAFIRKGQSTTNVSIDNVEHIRTKSKNYYLCDGEPIDPKKAQAIINIDAVNLQEQHDTPFLLKDSPGEVARKLALLIDLTKPQNSLRELKVKGSKLESKRNGLISLKTNLEEQLTHYALLQKYKRSLLRIESKMASIEKQRQAMATLAGAIENATQAQLRLSTMPNTKQYGSNLSGLLKRVVEAAEKHKSAETLRGAITSVEEKEKMRIPDISYLKGNGEILLDKVALQLSVVKMTDTVDTILKKTRKFTVCLTKGKSVIGMLPALEGFIQDIERVNQTEKTLLSLRTLRGDITTVNKEYEEKQQALNALRDSIDICPLCGR